MPIRETSDYFIIEKNTHLPSAGTIPFKSIFIDFGLDEPTGKVKIREIFYPKSEYQRADVKRLYKSLEDCPNCTIGKQLDGIDTISQNTFKDMSNVKHDRSGPSLVRSITGIFDPITKNPRTSTVYGSELLANVAELPVDSVAGALGGKLAKLLMGLGFAWGGTRTSGRMSDELHEIASHLIFRILDPTPEQMFALRSDVSKVTSALAEGNPIRAAKALFRPAALSKFGMGYGKGDPGLDEKSASTIGPPTLPINALQSVPSTQGLGLLPRPVPVDPGFNGSFGSMKLPIH